MSDPSDLFCAWHPSQLSVCIALHCGATACPELLLMGFVLITINLERFFQPGFENCSVYPNDFYFP